METRVQRKLEFQVKKSTRSTRAKQRALNRSTAESPRKRFSDGTVIKSKCLNFPFTPEEVSHLYLHLCDTLLIRLLLCKSEFTLIIISLGILQMKMTQR